MHVQCNLCYNTIRCGPMHAVRMDIGKWLNKSVNISEFTSNYSCSCEQTLQKYSRFWYIYILKISLVGWVAGSLVGCLVSSASCLYFWVNFGWIRWKWIVLRVKWKSVTAADSYDIIYLSRLLCYTRSWYFRIKRTNRTNGEASLITESAVTGLLNEFIWMNEK